MQGCIVKEAKRCLQQSTTYSPRPSAQLSSTITRDVCWKGWGDLAWKLPRVSLSSGRLPQGAV